MAHIMAARPTSKWLVFKRETSAAARYITSMYSVSNKDQGAVLGIIKWYGPFRQYSFIPSSDCVFERTCLRDIANFCEWLTAEHKAGNKKPD
jgi:hypothetical protein